MPDNNLGQSKGNKEESIRYGAIVHLSSALKD